MKNLSKSFVWILMGLLFVGLAGFGAVNVTGTARTLVTVGDATVSMDDYARALQQEQRTIQSQSGQAFPISQLLALGVDRSVMSRLVSIASLDNETMHVGLSVGDETLLEEIAQVQAFQDSSGAFNRDSYRFALQNAGLTEAEFEQDMRRETARTLLQGAILGGVEMPSVMTQTMVDYIGARRSFSFVTLTPADVALTAVEPTEEQLKAFYDANIDAFTLPRSKELTYVSLRPDALVDEVEVDADALRQLYTEREAEFNVPERRLVERLVFPDQEAAATAKAQLETGGATFETLVEGRKLTLSDVDLGDVAREDLDDAGDAVFAAALGDVVGPLPSPFGPALFRVNGLLEAKFTSFEDATPVLREELAMERARRLIETRAEDIDDQLAGGATLEELAAADGLELGQLSWTADATDGIAAYDAFRSAAQAVTVDDFPSVAFLEDGSLFALRLNEVLEPRPEEFTSARDAVRAAYAADRIKTAVNAAAETLLQQTQAADGQFPEAASVTTETGLTRTAYLDQTPVDLIAEVFKMEVGEARVVTGEENTVVVHLDEILPPEANADADMLTKALGEQLSQTLAAEVFQIYLEQIQLNAQAQINQQAVNAVHASFQ